MSTSRVSKPAARQLALSILGLLLACSGSDKPPPAADVSISGRSSTNGASPSGKGGTAAGAPIDAPGAVGGAQQASGGAGAGGDDQPSASAGDGPIELGPEQCFDGLDNDANDATDCADPVCERACASSCKLTTTLADPSHVTGNTRQHAAKLGSACSDPDGSSGSEIVYDFVAETSGMLDIVLSTVAPELTLSLRKHCDDDESEVTCSTTHRLTVPVQAGEALFIVVDGYSAAAAGKYALSAATRPIACGDGVRDASEGCDDGDETSGDGCSSKCQVESSEQNPNDAIGQADLFDPSSTDYYYGELSKSGDVDWVAVELPGPSSTLAATTQDFGDGACDQGLLDSAIAIYGPDKALIIENDDDPLGVGACALAVADSLAAGTYYVRVAATPADPELTFPYALKLSIY